MHFFLSRQNGAQKAYHKISLNPIAYKAPKKCIKYKLLRDNSFVALNFDLWATYENGDKLSLVW